MNLHGVRALPTGNVIDLKNPGQYKFTLEEIAILLGEIKRFNGFGVSVADHSVWVAHTLYLLTGNPHIALAGLFHDAQEGYIGDLATPVKNLVGSEWEKLEHAINSEISSQLRIKNTLNLCTMPLVKYVDMLALGYELEYLTELKRFTKDDEGVWDEVFRDVKPLSNSIYFKETDEPSETFKVVYLTYAKMAEDTNIEYVECSYITKDGKYSCMVADNKITTFTDALGGDVC